MSDVSTNEPQFVIKKSPTEDRYMKFSLEHGIEWVTEAYKANRYPSKFAAKRHKGIIVDMPSNAIIRPL